MFLETVARIAREVGLDPDAAMAMYVADFVREVALRRASQAERIALAVVARKRRVA